MTGVQTCALPISQKNADMMQTLLAWYQAKKIKPPIHTTLSMQALPEAYDLMNSRAVKGKLVLVNL